MMKIRFLLELFLYFVIFCNNNFSNNREKSAATCYVCMSAHQAAKKEQHRVISMWLGVEQRYIDQYGDVQLHASESQQTLL